MHDTWMERLSEYLDETMDRAEREAIEAHVDECPTCAGVLGDLRKIRAKARELVDAPVPKELWPRIERAIASGGATPIMAPRIVRMGGGPFSFSLPQLLAACLVVAIVSGGAVFAVLRNQAKVVSQPVRTASSPLTRGANTAPRPRSDASTREPQSPTIDAVPAVQMDQSPAVAAITAETPHEEAISELRKALAKKRDQLDPGTVRTLETNLAIIDLAIDQAKRALVADSANTYVKEHLADTMRRKVELLQRATMLASSSGLEESR